MRSTRSSDHCRWFDNLSFQHFLSGDDIKCNNMEREFVSTVQQASFEKGTLLRILEQVTRPTEFLWKLAESCCAGEHGAWRPVETDVERFWSHQSFIWGEGTALSIKWCNARVDAFFLKVACANMTSEYIHLTRDLEVSCTDADFQSTHIYKDSLSRTVFCWNLDWTAFLWEDVL